MCNIIVYTETISFKNNKKSNIFGWQIYFKTKSDAESTAQDRLTTKKYKKKRGRLGQKLF